jgi:hypothetical protein
MYASSMIRIHGNYATIADIRGLLAVTTDPERKALLEACLRMRGVA